MTTRGVRFGRQTKLAEIGEAGQARLEETTVSLATSGFAGTIERTYLERAGMRIADGGPGPPLDSSILGLRHVAARDVADGAFAALAAIRTVVLR